MSKSSIDEIWASMNEEVAPKKLPNFEKLQKTKKTASKKKADMNDPLKILGNTKKDVVEVIDCAKEAVSVTSVEATEISLNDLQPKLNKEINALSDSSHVVRRNGLQNLQTLLLVDHKLSSRDYSELFHDLCRPLFKRFADPVEKCRELSQRVTKSFFENAMDVVPVLAYYFPALMQRIPPDLGYDDELKVFVIDREAHDAYKRGKAVERQDKAGAVSGQSTVVVETSEEIRYLACDALCALLQRIHTLGAYPVLHPYFEEIIIFLQLQLRDPYPELKMIACQAFETLARIPDFEIGMKYYSVAICRSILPVLRHRHAKVRTAAVTALHQVMIVPDRGKRKGSGTDAIQDMVGFREENILPIAAFYKDDVQVNYLAELVSDKSPQVREKLVEFLSSLLTEIGDRYDHQTRLLPYLLDLMTDELETIATNAYRCLQICGKQYEEEHVDEILEKRQYGIDGDDRINLEKPLPKPFSERPRIGMRMYVRGNSKRFLLALVNELTNWIAPTRLKSGNLLKLVIVLCEEHTTMEMHTMLPQLMKSLKFARDDKDVELQAVLREVFELLGRYILPEIYLYYILPRLRGDPDVQPFGVDAETRCTAMEMLSSLLEGSKTNTIVPFFQELVQTLTDPFVISSESVKQQSSAMGVLHTILSVFHGKSKQAIEAFYVATGRITSLQVTIRQIFRYLLLQMSTKELREQAWQVLILLSHLETDPVSLHQDPIVSVARLFYLHGPIVLSEEINRYEIDGAWSVSLPEHQVILRLLEFPAYVIHQDTRAVRILLAFIMESVRSLRQQPSDAKRKGNGMVIHETSSTTVSNELETEISVAMNKMTMLLLSPLILSQDSEQLMMQFQASDASYNGLLVNKPKTESPTVDNGFGSLFSKTMNSRMHSVLVALHHEQDSLVEELIQEMILSSRWSRNPVLNQCRMELLFLLLGKINNSRNRNLIDEDDGAKLLLQPLLMRHMNAMVMNLSAVGLIPASSEAIRIDTIQLIATMLRELQMYSGLKKVYSKKKVAANFLEEENTNSSIFACTSRHQYLDCKGCAQSSLYKCLQVLDDASDSVRVLALKTLMNNIQFLFTCSEEIEEWKSRLAPLETTVQLVDSHLTLARISTTLFRRSILELFKVSSSSILKADLESSQAFIDLLDTTLRLICVIDPHHFEEIVRKESASVLANDPSDIVVEYINGLVNHADILLSF